MAVNFNKVILGGNLTRDPQIRFFANERCVGNFGLAVNRRWKDKDGQQQEETTFVDVEVWGRTAELAGQYLTKGRACLIEGRLKLDQWEDKDGNRRQALKVSADTIQFLDPPQQGGNQAPAAQRQAQAATAPPANPNFDDEPPF
jgi:single-strand DNA-binding protein